MLPSSASSKARPAVKKPTPPESTSSSSSLASVGSTIPRVHSPLGPGRSPQDSSRSSTPPQSASSTSAASSASTSRVFSDSPKSATTALLTPPQIHQLLPSPMPVTQAQPTKQRPRGQSTSSVHLDAAKAGEGSSSSGGGGNMSKAMKRISHPVASTAASIRRDVSVDHIASHDDDRHDPTITSIPIAYPSDTHISSSNHPRSANAIYTFTSLPQSNPRGRSVPMTPRLEQPSQRGRKSGRNKSSGSSRSRSPDAIIELPGQEGVDGVVNSGLRPGQPVPGHLETDRVMSSSSRSSSPGHSPIEPHGASMTVLLSSASTSTVVQKTPVAASFHQQMPTPYQPGGSKPFDGGSHRSVSGPSVNIGGVWGGDMRHPRPWQGSAASPAIESRKEPSMSEWEKVRDAASSRAMGKAKDIPEEQVEGWLATREQVARAAKSVLGTTGDITHELLQLSVDYVEFVPVPGLQHAVKTLLQIWDSLQGVDLNRMACLGLVQDCASAVLAIRDEIQEAGVSVVEETNKPFRELNEVFLTIKNMMDSISTMSFLKRYLKRDDISRQIRGCHDKLDKALQRFNNSIALRTLKHILYTRDQSEEIRNLVEKLFNKELPLSMPQPATTVPPTTPISTSQSNERHGTHAAEGWKALNDVRTRMRDVDNAYDMADLRRLMQVALQAGSDVEMIKTLQVGRDSMPEAIKALQREIEREGQRNTIEPSASGVSQAGTSTLMDVDARPPKVVRRVSVTQVPLAGRLETDASGNFILEDVIESPSAVAPGGEEPQFTLPAGEQGGGATVTGPSPGEKLARRRTVVSIESADSGYADEMKPKDTLDMEFMESGLDALRRMSKGIDKTLPSWAITEFEIYYEEQVGVGFFSEVYRGTWRNRTVAIKQLHRGAPQRPFIREVEIWKSLKHPNVLKLLGASSPSTPPYFLVSPYMKNGSLVEFLGRIAREREADASSHSSAIVGNSPMMSGSGLLRGGSLQRRSPSPGTRARGSPGGGAGIGGWRMLSLPPGSSGSGSMGLSGSGSGSTSGAEHGEPNLLRFMHEIAKGLAYLHSQSVLHGDLKAANVLVTDKLRCVITDFGQSEMKSVAARLSGAQQSHGTLRWQAPELMQGASALTAQMDIYAYAITCVEILNMGKLPWSLMDDDSVRYFVLKENGRPPLPVSRFTTPGLEDLLRQAWHRDPSQRPPFSRLVPILKQMRQAFDNGGEEAISPSMSDQLELEPVQRPSPDIRPIPLPFPPSGYEHTLDALGVSPASSSYGSYRTPHDASTSHAVLPCAVSEPEDFTPEEPIAMPEPDVYHGSEVHSRISSDGEDIYSTTGEHLDIFHYDGYETPPPLDERLKQIRNERRYRMLLNHEFHPSLTLPLWTPSPVALGAVGYLLKPQGSFVTLFNATNPLNSAGVNMASLKGYGEFSTGKQRNHKRLLPQRWFDSLTSIFTSRNDHIRKYTFPLRVGHRHAYLCAETTQYRYFEDLETPKKWFKSNVDTILELYGSQHDIQTEDLYLVIGTLSAPNYGLFVCHRHPNGQAHFNVYGSQRAGQPWGSYTTDTELPQTIGPSYPEADVETFDPQFASKVSIVGDGPWDSLLLAKLRFMPDAMEPTSL